MKSLGDFLWVRIPTALGRLSPAIRAVLMDGRELRVVPILGDLAPLLALAAGLLLSASRGLGPLGALVDETYASSPLLLIAFVGISTLGGALGAWAWLGYVIADLFLVGRIWFALELPRHLLIERVPQAITYLLLFGLMALLPPAVTVMRAQLAGVTARAGPGGWLGAGVIQALLSAAFVGSWALAIPALLPPYWTWIGRVAPVPAISTPNHFAWLLALTAMVMAGGRIAVAAAAERRGLVSGAEVVERAVEPASGVRRVLGIVIGTALLSLALAGLARTLPDALLLVGGLLFATLLRSELVPRLTGYVALVSRVPLLARVAISAAAAALLGWALIAIGPRGQLSGPVFDQSYTALVISIVVSAVLAALLMPSEGRRTPSSAAGAPS